MELEPASGSRTPPPFGARAIVDMHPRSWSRHDTRHRRCRIHRQPLRPAPHGERRGCGGLRQHGAGHAPRPGRPREGVPRQVQGVRAGGPEGPRQHRLRLPGQGHRGGGALRRLLPGRRIHARPPQVLREQRGRHHEPPRRHGRRRGGDDRLLVHRGHIRRAGVHAD